MKQTSRDVTRRVARVEMSTSFAQSSGFRQDWPWSLMAKDTSLGMFVYMRPNKPASSREKVLSGVKVY